MLETLLCANHTGLLLGVLTHSSSLSTFRPCPTWKDISSWPQIRKQTGVHTWSFWPLVTSARLSCIHLNVTCFWKLPGFSASWVRTAGSCLPSIYHHCCFYYFLFGNHLFNLSLERGLCLCCPLPSSNIWPTLNPEEVLCKLWLNDRLNGWRAFIGSLLTSISLLYVVVRGLLCCDLVPLTRLFKSLCSGCSPQSQRWASLQPGSACTGPGYLLAGHSLCLLQTHLSVPTQCQFNTGWHLNLSLING